VEQRAALESFCVGWICLRMPLQDGFTEPAMDARHVAVMRLGAPLDPALEAASQALHGRARQHSSRFASIELRGQSSAFSRFAPVGYVFSALLGLLVVIVLWTL